MELTIQSCFENWLDFGYNRNLHNDEELLWSHTSAITNKTAEFLANSLEKTPRAIQIILAIPQAVITSIIRIAERVARLFEFLIKTIIAGIKGQKDEALTLLVETGKSLFFALLIPVETCINIPYFSVKIIQYAFRE